MPADQPYPSFDANADARYPVRNWFRVVRDVLITHWRWLQYLQLRGRRHQVLDILKIWNRAARFPVLSGLRSPPSFSAILHKLHILRLPFQNSPKSHFDIDKDFSSIDKDLSSIDQGVNEKLP